LGKNEPDFNVHLSSQVARHLEWCLGCLLLNTNQLKSPLRAFLLTYKLTHIINGLERKRKSLVAPPEMEGARHCVPKSQFTYVYIYILLFTDVQPRIC